MQENRRAIKVGGGRCNLFSGRSIRATVGGFSRSIATSIAVFICIASSFMVKHTIGARRASGRPNADLGDDLSPDPLSAAATIAHGKGHPRRRPQLTAMCTIYTTKSLRLDLSADKTYLEGV